MTEASKWIDVEMVDDLVYGDFDINRLDPKNDAKMGPRRRIWVSRAALEHHARAGVAERWKDHLFIAGERITYTTDISTLTPSRGSEMNVIIIPGLFTAGGVHLYLRAHKSGILKVVLRDAATTCAPAVAAALVRELGPPFMPYAVRLRDEAKKDMEAAAQGQGGALVAGQAKRPECQKCHAITKLRCCSRCRSAGYCSSECQAADWAQHSKYCRPVQIPEVKAEAKTVAQKERARRKRERYRAKQTAGAGAASHVSEYVEEVD